MTSGAYITPHACKLCDSSMVAINWIALVLSNFIGPIVHELDPRLASKQRWCCLLARSHEYFLLNKVYIMCSCIFASDKLILLITALIVSSSHDYC